MQNVSKSAVLVIDMQNDFCSADGALANLGSDVARNQQVACALPEYLASARKHGHQVIWVKQNASLDVISPARAARAEAMGRNPLTIAEAGTWGAELYAPLTPAPADLIITKTHYSAFVGTYLHNALRARGITHLFVTGTAANVCVDSTIRDAYMSEYEVTLFEDLVGWTREEWARVAIENLGFYFCAVRNSSELKSPSPNSQN